MLLVYFVRDAYLGYFIGAGEAVPLYCVCCSLGLLTSLTLVFDPSFALHGFAF
jgi:hypothetical protein